MSPLTPADQTTFSSEHWPFVPGDCLSACVASVLDMRTEDVPLFVAEDDPSAVAQGDGLRWYPHDYLWVPRLREWVEGLGLQLKLLPPEARDAVPGFHILYGYSSVGGEHAVVGRAGRVVHDPDPRTRAGLATVTGVICIE